MCKLKIVISTNVIFNGPKRADEGMHSVVDARGPRGCIVASGFVLERCARSKGPLPNRRNLAIGAGHTPRANKKTSIIR